MSRKDNTHRKKIFPLGRGDTVLERVHSDTHMLCVNLMEFLKGVDIQCMCSCDGEDIAMVPAASEKTPLADGERILELKGTIVGALFGLIHAGVSVVIVEKLGPAIWHDFTNSDGVMILGCKDLDFVASKIRGASKGLWWVPMWGELDCMCGNPECKHTFSHEGGGMRCDRCDVPLCSDRCCSTHTLRQCDLGIAFFAKIYTLDGRDNALIARAALPYWAMSAPSIVL